MMSLECARTAAFVAVTAFFVARSIIARAVAAERLRIARAVHSAAFQFEHDDVASAIRLVGGSFLHDPNPNPAATAHAWRQVRKFRWLSGRSILIGAARSAEMLNQAKDN